ncbi:hypothetical protein EG329_002096 [Mollisiaceae sp. DMI_Dod_QoI]|nr:hypothetical protein EG329_002096 [Helotiales sp. DMI_Dod_QoI]
MSGETKAQWYIHHIKDDWYFSIDKAPLSYRAWVLQERFLSPRIIHFGLNRLFWECCESRAAETLSSSSLQESFRNFKNLPSGIRENEDDDVRLHKAWWDIVSRYSQCQLAVASDKLPALAGLASRFCRQLQLNADDYAAGIWRTTLPDALLWRTAQSYSRRDQVARVPGRAPSWSWASIDGMVEMSVFTSRYGCQYIKILKCATFLKSHPFGEVTGGYVHLQAPLLKVQVTGDNGHPSLAEIVSASVKRTKPLSMLQKLIQWDESMSAGVEGVVGFLLFDGCRRKLSYEDHDHVSGLIMQPTGRKSGQFQRLGFLSGEIDGFDAILKRALNPRYLPPDWYMASDHDKGFTIELV